MEQRKLLLPPFKGQRMKAYEPIIEEIAAADIESWPAGHRVPGRAADAAHHAACDPARGVRREGERLHALEELIPRWTALGPRVSRCRRGSAETSGRARRGARSSAAARSSTRSSTS